MNEEFVRKEVHDLEILRLNRDMEDLREKVRSLETKSDSLSWDLVLISAIFLLTVFFLSISIHFMR